MLLRVILAVENPQLRKRLQELLSDADVLVESVRGKKHLLERAAHRSGDVIIAELSVVAEHLDGSIALIRELPESPTLIVLTDREDAEHQAEVLTAGCDVVLYSGLPEETLTDALKAVLDKRQGLLVGAGAGRRPLAQPQLSDFVSESATMQAFMAMVKRIANSHSSLLILGETGVGKERLARAIHTEGPQSEGPFVPVNCGALPESLLESELFGHEEGAFTGAIRSRRGAFELAHGGTIFLDEIAEMPVHLQVKLLRAVQEREIRRIGGERPFEVDVRVMAASNRDLECEVREGRFRQDLYYRLSVVSLTIPPLRQRREDIPALVESYVDHLRPRVGRNIYEVDEQALSALCRYAWPGNVRELINVIERAMLLCSGDTITPQDLPASISGAFPASTSAGALVVIPRNEEEVPAEWLDKTLPEVRAAVVADLERSYLAAALRHTDGRISETAERAGIEPRSLYEKMKRYGLRKEDFRPRKPRK